MLQISANGVEFGGFGLTCNNTVCKMDCSLSLVEASKFVSLFGLCVRFAFVFLFKLFCFVFLFLVSRHCYLF